MLQLTNISKQYNNKLGKKTLALNNVSLTFEDKGLVFITGASGSGKTTLLNIIGGVDTVTSGSYRVNNVEISRLSNATLSNFRKKNIGFIFQEFNTIDHLNVKQNMCLSYTLTKQKINDGAIIEALTAVGLKNFLDRYPKEISVGQRQRVAVARAIVNKPTIILADEPTGSVDKNTGDSVWKLLKKLSQDRLIIATTHDNLVAQRYGDRLITLDNGAVVSDRKIVKGKQIVMQDNIIKVPANFVLEEGELDQINTAIRSTRGDSYLFLTNNREVIKELSPNALNKIETRKIEEDADIAPSPFSFPFSFNNDYMSRGQIFKLALAGFSKSKFKSILTVTLTIVSLLFFAVFCMLNNFSIVTCLVDATVAENNSFVNIQRISRDGAKVNYQRMPLEDAMLTDIFNNTGVIAQKIFDVNWEFDFFTDNTYSIGGLAEAASLTSSNIQLIYGSLNSNLSAGVYISDYMAKTLLDYKVSSSEGVLDNNYIVQELIENEMEIYLQGGTIKIKIAGIYKTDYLDYLAMPNLQHNQGYLYKYNYNINNVYNTIFVPYNFINDYIGKINYSVNVGSTFSVGNNTTTKNTYYVRGGTSLASGLDVYPLGGTLNQNLTSKQVFVSLPIYNALFGKSIEVDDFVGYESDYAGAYNDLLKVNNSNYTITCRANNGSEEKTFIVKGVIASTANSIVTCTDDFISVLKPTITPTNRFSVWVGDYNPVELTRLGNYLLQNNMLYSSSNGGLASDFYYRFSVLKNVFLFVAVASALFSAFLAVLFVINIAQSNNKDIGLLRAMGAVPLDITRVFFMQGVLFSVLSLLLAFLLIFAVSSVFNSIFTTAFCFPLKIMSNNFSVYTYVFLINFVTVCISSLILSSISNKRQGSKLLN